MRIANVLAASRSPKPDVLRKSGGRRTRSSSTRRLGRFNRGARLAQGHTNKVIEASRADRDVRPLRIQPSRTPSPNPCLSYQTPWFQRCITRRNSWRRLLSAKSGNTDKVVQYI